MTRRKKPLSEEEPFAVREHRVIQGLDEIEEERENHWNKLMLKIVQLESQGAETAA